MKGQQEPLRHQVVEFQLKGSRAYPICFERVEQGRGLTVYIGKAFTESQSFVIRNASGEIVDEL
jgi:hypothetical protein